MNEVHDRTFSIELFDKGDAFPRLLIKYSSFFAGALKGKRHLFSFLHAGLWSKPVTLAQIFFKKNFNTKQHQVKPNNFPITNKHFQKIPQFSNKCFLAGFGCIFNFKSFLQTLIGIFIVFR